MIVYPREALDVLAREVARFTRENEDPKVAMHFYCLDLVQGAFVGRESVPGLAVLVYDARGKEHGRGVFSWALGIPGARDATRAMSYREVVEQGGEYRLSTLWCSVSTMSMVSLTLYKMNWKQSVDKQIR